MIVTDVCGFVCLHVKYSTKKRVPVYKGVNDQRSDGGEMGDIDSREGCNGTFPGDNEEHSRKANFA